MKRICTLTATALALSIDLVVPPSLLGQTLTILHEFGAGGVPDISRPDRTLMEASDGFLYGIASGNLPSPSGSAGNGELYRLKKDGSEYRLLYSFTNSGFYNDRPIEGTDGLLYGVCFSNGPSGVYRLNRDGSNFAFLSFPDRSNDAQFPQGLIKTKQQFAL